MTKEGKGEERMKDGTEGLKVRKIKNKEEYEIQKGGNMKESVLAERKEGGCKDEALPGPPPASGERGGVFDARSLPPDAADTLEVNRGRGRHWRPHTCPPLLPFLSSSCSFLWHAILRPAGVRGGSCRGGAGRSGQRGWSGRRPPVPSPRPPLQHLIKKSFVDDPRPVRRFQVSCGNLITCLV